MSRYIAAYDVSDDRQRDRVVRVLEQFGYRIQLSVFEMDLDEEDLLPLQRSVGALLAQEDRFELIPVDSDPRRKRLRWMHPEMSQAVIVVE